MADSKLNFGEKLTELEGVTSWFESDQVDLDVALKKFERGMELVNELKTYLATVENRVEAVKRKFDAPLEPSQEPVVDAPQSSGSADLFS